MKLRRLEIKLLSDYVFFGKAVLLKDQECDVIYDKGKFDVETNDGLIMEIPTYELKYEIISGSLEEEEYVAKYNDMDGFEPI